MQASSVQRTSARSKRWLKSPWGTFKLSFEAGHDKLCVGLYGETTQGDLFRHLPCVTLVYNKRSSSINERAGNFWLLAEITGRQLPWPVVILPMCIHILSSETNLVLSFLPLPRSLPNEHITGLHVLSACISHAALHGQSNAADMTWHNLPSDFSAENVKKVLLFSLIDFSFQ